MTQPMCLPLMRQGLDPLDSRYAREFAEKICPQCPVQTACATAAATAKKDGPLFGAWAGKCYRDRQEAAA